MALGYLRHKGYTPVERNYRTQYGEIDLIMRHEKTLVFVEVKLRRGTGFGDPLEAVTPRKQARIRHIAEQVSGLASRADTDDERAGEALQGGEEEDESYRSVP